MTKVDAKRGYVPEDERNFSPEAIEKMITASRHICYLLNEGYDLKQATVFVGNHFLLSERQRLALMRSVASEKQLAEREKKRIPITDLKDQEVWIDGFNTIITLEVLLCDSLLFECMWCRAHIAYASSSRTAHRSGANDLLFTAGKAEDRRTCC